MAYDADERITVVAGATTVGVTVALGEVQVTAHLPLPVGVQQMTQAQVRAAALKAARRALEVALQELQIAADEA